MTELDTTMKTPAGGLVLRDSPDASDELSDRLEGMQRVTVLERWGSWAKVETGDGLVGWVDGRQLIADIRRLATASAVRKMDYGEKLHQVAVGGGGAVAVFGFFRPWVETWLSFGPLISSDSGMSFAKLTESHASGNSLAILWIALIAAALLLALAACGYFVRLDSLSYRVVCGIQVVLAAAGIVVIWITVPGEIDTWYGLVIEYKVGIWVTTIGLAVAGLAALVGVASRPSRRLFA